MPDSPEPPTLGGVPGPPRRKLADSGRERLQAALNGIEVRWAKLVRELGYSAVAREIGLTPEAVRKRVRGDPQNLHFTILGLSSKT